MGALIVRFIALTLVLVAVVCVGVLFIGGLWTLIDLRRAGDGTFAGVVARIHELRMWGIVGVGSILLAVGLQWFYPDRREEDETEE